MPRRKPLNGKNVFILFCLVMQAVLLLFLFQFAWLRAAAVRASGFLPIQARVVSVGVRKHSTKYSSYYTPILTYRYEVEGREYEGTGTGYGTDQSQEVALENARARYPLGRELEAFYNPEDPAESVLHRGVVIDMLPVCVCLGGLSLPLLPGCLMGLQRFVHFLRARSPRPRPPG